MSSSYIFTTICPFLLLNMEIYVSTQSDCISYHEITTFIIKYLWVNFELFDMPFFSISENLGCHTEWRLISKNTLNIKYIGIVQNVHHWSLCDNAYFGLIRLTHFYPEFFECLSLCVLYDRSKNSRYCLSTGMKALSLQYCFYKIHVIPVSSPVEVDSTGVYSWLLR